MKCPRCQYENPLGSNFCLACGTRLSATCGACGNDLPVGSRFCNKCGTPVSGESAGQARFASPESYTPRHLAEKILTSRAALEGERKQVTVLFADLKGSMELLADRDPEEARRILDPVLERMMEAVHRYEGTVNQVMGDGIMALFGAPLAHEDHAVRACYAALRMQDAIKAYADGVFRAHGVSVQSRIGLNSGEAGCRASSGAAMRWPRSTPACEGRSRGAASRWVSWARRASAKAVSAMSSSSCAVRAASPSSKPTACRTHGPRPSACCAWCCWAPSVWIRTRSRRAKRFPNASSPLTPRSSTCSPSRTTSSPRPIHRPPSRREAPSSRSDWSQACSDGCSAPAAPPVRSWFISTTPTGSIRRASDCSPSSPTWPARRGHFSC